MQTELYPRLIQDEPLSLNDLGNINDLWEELWLTTLQDHMGNLTFLGYGFLAFDMDPELLIFE